VGVAHLVESSLVEVGLWVGFLFRLPDHTFASAKLTTLGIHKSMRIV
jgi:hypothetical protein